MKKIADVVLSRQQNASQEAINFCQNKLHELIGSEYHPENIQSALNRFIEKATSETSATATNNHQEAARLGFGRYAGAGDIGAYRFRLSENKDGKFIGSFFGIGMVNSNIDFEFIVG